MEVVKLTKETNEIQRVVTLKSNRNKRHRYQEFVIEGQLAIDEAFKMGWRIKSLFYDKDTVLSQWAQNHLNKQLNEVTYVITKPLMELISEKTDTSELIAVAETQNRQFASLQPKQGDVIVVLDEPKSPGNMGMMIRSAQAFGASAIVISGHGADEYDPKCIRASVGTFFSMPIFKTHGIQDFVEKMEGLRKYLSIAIVASGDKGSVSIEEMHCDADVIFLVLGNETSGISSGYKQVADQFIQIPLPGKFTSLNIAAAGSIFLYEIFRSKNKKSLFH